MTGTATADIILDVDQTNDALVQQIAEQIGQLEARFGREAEIQLNFRLIKGGVEKRVVSRTLTPTDYLTAEQDIVFPKVVEQILQREFPPTVAQNDQLRQHVMGELRKDPYWSTQVVDLIKTIKGQ